MAFALGRSRSDLSFARYTLDHVDRNSASLSDMISHPYSQLYLFDTITQASHIG